MKTRREIVLWAFADIWGWTVGELADLVEKEQNAPVPLPSIRRLIHTLRSEGVNIVTEWNRRWGLKEYFKR